MTETVKILAQEKMVDGGKGLVFFCPGCKFYHSFTIELGSDKNKPLWTWNEDLEKPTFSPSLLVNGTTDMRCHSYVRDGKIEYLSDCWHESRGQTVDMQEIDW